MGKPNMNAKKGEFLKQCSGCFIPTHINLIGECYGNDTYWFLYTTNDYWWGGIGLYKNLG